MAKMKKTRTRGIWQRRDHFYMRKREGSTVRWVSLGDNYEQAPIRPAAGAAKSAARGG